MHSVFCPCGALVGVQENDATARDYCIDTVLAISVAPLELGVPTMFYLINACHNEACVFGDTLSHINLMSPGKVLPPLNFFNIQAEARKPQTFISVTHSANIL
jgi:hypothetical protein